MTRVPKPVGLEVGSSRNAQNKFGAMILEGAHINAPQYARKTVEAEVSASSITQKKSRGKVPDGAMLVPKFILHVGPPKTGTSTIQAFAATHDDLLRKDNIYYLGHYGKRQDLNMHEFSNLCRLCQGKQDCDCNKKWEEFSKLVNYHHSQNHSVMLSDETFYRYKNENDEQAYLWDHLVPLLKNWDVRIVYTYRRYFEWIPSTYHQSFNPAGKKRKETRSNWPGSGGLTIPSFPVFLDTFMKLSAKQPSALKKKWEDHFSNIWVFNMHDDGPFLRNFFCRMVQGTQICNFLRSQTTELTKNPSSSKILHYDMLATEAYQRGLVKKGLKRTAVNRAVMDHSIERGLSSISDFPLKCLSQKQTDQFLNVSLALESAMVPKFFSSTKGETDLRKKFVEASDAGKFCSVDVDAVLKDGRWQKFFKKLGAET